tara:strand:+ start:15912 stop:16328 length:417 start_codon:yes stop_codon:yes gene_type:complete
MDINTLADAVSRRPIEVVQAVYEAYARRDLPRIATLYHPDCELMQTGELPWGGVYRGHAGLARFFDRLTQAIDTQIVHETLIEAGNDVVSVGRTKGVAMKTGRAFELDAVHIYTVEESKIRRSAAYVDTPAMRRAIGA